MQIPQCAEKYVDLLYGRHGRGPLYYDCWGLLMLFFKQEFGIDLPAYDFLYADEAEISEALAFTRGEDSPWREVKEKEVRFGDVALFFSLRDVLHVGVVLDQVHFLHCNIYTEYACVERLDSASWRNRKIGFFRHAELANRE